MTIEKLKEVMILVSKKYPIERVYLFGSRADGTNKNDSDVDLIIEFSETISLLTLSKIRVQLEEMLGLDVDVIHGPLQDSDLLEVNKEVDLYVA